MIGIIQIGGWLVHDEDFCRLTDCTGNLFYTFFNCFKDIGRDFFQSCKDRTFYGVSRTKWWICWIQR